MMIYHVTVRNKNLFVSLVSIPIIVKQLKLLNYYKNLKSLLYQLGLLHVNANLLKVVSRWFLLKHSWIFYINSPIHDHV